MPYLIDGHNLIPHLGISLSDVDDEEQLIALLQEFCRLGRKRAEVYFDDAPPGQPARRKYGSVMAHYVRAPREADHALAARLQKLSGEAKNWVVVSSDRQVRAAARAAHARVATAEAFARELRGTLASSARRGAVRDAGVSEDELHEWLRVFEKK
jgi:predicted RNA-binding protein with PIN domain